MKLGRAVKSTLFIHAEAAFYTDLSLANIAILLHLRQDCCIWDRKIWDDGSHAMSHPKTRLAGSFCPMLIPVTAQPWWSHLQLNWMCFIFSQTFLVILKPVWQVALSPCLSLSGLFLFLSRVILQIPELWKLVLCIIWRKTNNNLSKACWERWS